MVIATRLIQGAEISQAFGGPKLAGTLEAALLLATGRFDRPRANRPAALRHCLVIHPPGMRGKIMAFSLNDLSRHAFAPL